MSLKQLGKEVLASILGQLIGLGLAVLILSILLKFLT